MLGSIGRFSTAASRCTSKRPFVVLLLLVLLTAPAIALAHAKLIESDPAPGAVVTQSPERVIARFSDELDRAGSSMSVVDGQGRQVNQDNGGVDLDDPDHASMIAVLPPALSPGTYTARWTAVSDSDGHQGHQARGSFTFKVQ